MPWTKLRNLIFIAETTFLILNNSSDEFAHFMKIQPLTYYHVSELKLLHQIVGTIQELKISKIYI